MLVHDANELVGSVVGVAEMAAPAIFILALFIFDKKFTAKFRSANSAE